MTSQSPRIYLYKITFEEVPYYYYGIKREKYFNQEYWGSPVTNKWCWKLYTPKKQILQVFDYSDEGWLEANKVEQRVIRPFYNTDKWCLNENCGGVMSLQTHSEAGKKGAQTNKENNLGIFALTKEERIKNGKKLKELGVGIHAFSKEQVVEVCRNAGKIGGRKSAKTRIENKLGIFGFTKEQFSENGKKAGKIGGKISANQKWMCLETGFITNAGNLTKYQRARGIDTTKRVRIS
jgi:hypothetical protein